MDCLPRCPRTPFRHLLPPVKEQHGGSHTPGPWGSLLLDPVTQNKSNSPRGKEGKGRQAAGFSPSNATLPWGGQPQHVDTAGHIPDPHLIRSVMLELTLPLWDLLTNIYRGPVRCSCPSVQNCFPAAPACGCVSQQQAAKPRGQGFPKAIFPQETSVLQAQGLACESVCVRIPESLHIGSAPGDPHGRLPEHLPYQPHQ